MGEAATRMAAFQLLAVGLTFLLRDVNLAKGEISFRDFVNTKDIVLGDFLSLKYLAAKCPFYCRGKTPAGQIWASYQGTHPHLSELANRSIHLCAGKPPEYYQRHPAHAGEWGKVCRKLTTKRCME